MQTFPEEGGDGATDLIAVCPEFWTAIDQNNGYSKSMDSISTNALVKMQPLVLGLEFGARLLYHETFHLTYLQNDDIDNRDCGYSIDEGFGVTADPRLTELVHTAHSIGNPDTYSYYALLAWRRAVCGWQWSDNYHGEDLNSPLTNIPKPPESPGKALYGEPARCPRPATRATIDTVKGQLEGH